MSEPQKSKVQIREEILKKRKSISQVETIRAGENIVSRALHFISHSTQVLLYAPIHGELPTFSLFETLKRRSKCFFPRVLEQSGDLAFFEIENLDELHAGKWSLEPRGTSREFEANQPTIIFVPGVAFTGSGQRLGFGKGFYDKFLAKNPQSLRVGLAYDFQVLSTPWPNEFHDQNMDFVLSPGGLWGSQRIRFSGLYGATLLHYEGVLDGGSAP